MSTSSAQFVKPLGQPVPPSCVVSFTSSTADFLQGCCHHLRTRHDPISTSKPAYLSDLLLQDYWPARTLRSSDKLLLSVPRMALAFSAKAFSVSAPSVWNSLSYQCRSAELFSSFRRILKTELFDIAYSERKQSAYCPPVCASDSLATHGAIQICFDWSINWIWNTGCLSRRIVRKRDHD